MVTLAASLKRNAQAMKAAVERRGGQLDETEFAIDESLIRAKKSSKQASAMKIRYVPPECPRSSVCTSWDGPSCLLEFHQSMSLMMWHSVQTLKPQTVIYGPQGYITVHLAIPDSG